MKKKMLKLNLGKKTISNLNARQLDEQVGGRTNRCIGTGSETGTCLTCHHRTCGNGNSCWYHATCLFC